VSLRQETGQCCEISLEVVCVECVVGKLGSDYDRQVQQGNSLIVALKSTV